MYANDIALYEEISTQSGYARIQKGVDSLCVWIANNRLKQNAATLPSQGNMCPHCQISIFILRVAPSSLELTSSNTSVLSFMQSQRILNGQNTSTPYICNKTRRLIAIENSICILQLGDLTQTLQISISPSYMEYASAVVGSVPIRKDTKLIEDIQKFTLKVCTKNWVTKCSYNFLLYRAVISIRWLIAETRQDYRYAYCDQFKGQLQLNGD